MGFPMTLFSYLRNFNLKEGFFFPATLVGSFYKKKTVLHRQQFNNLNKCNAVHGTRILFTNKLIKKTKYNTNPRMIETFG
ncbi:unnamed protein product [Rhizophagus irregularis]|uniref:Uncharacterized protein n=1 Tax=Rhizophagus irregularis TaxID=588596 RepID=A0A915ZF55_9GLOM|nr:unnamed protein product [Rhizophagus irregularis]CAB5213244.1 unnamed protein product [Rhizophagus irregularis]CAB5372436.1 unnamed protein product [Rhizophagus irregularis]